MSIWTAITFFMIVVVCGFILFCQHFTKQYPVLISINPTTNEWKVIAYPDKEAETVNRYQVIQEKLVHDYITNWFTISTNEATNEARWKNCEVKEDCSKPEIFSPINITCALACKSSRNLYQEFVDNVLPVYRTKIAENAEFWKPERPQVVPGKIDENGSFWRGTVSVNTSNNESFKVLFFITVARDSLLYPATFGYYINEFYTYRISK